MAGKDSADSMANPGRRGRILRIALVISLALNLLVLGVMAGGVMKGGPGARATNTSDLRALWMALPDEARREMRPADAERRAGDRRAQREERRAQAAARQAELLALLRAPEFDADAFAAILLTDHEERSARIARAHRAFVDRVAALDAAARATVAARLEAGEGSRRTRR